MIKKYLALLIPILMLATLASSTSADLPDQPADGAWPVVTLPAELEVTAPDEVTDRSPDNPKLDSVLADLAESRDRANTAEATGLRLEHARVQAQVIAAPESETAARAAIAAAGGEVTGVFEDTLQVWLPPEQLLNLASSPAISYIQAPNTIVLADEETPAVTSEGLGPANAAEWHTAGWRGQGVRVAVIDGGFQGYPSKLGNDLPENVVVKNFVDGQPDAEVDATTRHGTACAEIVHDMAPLAELYLLKIATDVDLNEAVDYAVSQGVDVISTSLTFVNVTPGDGTGRFATITRKARDAGILWVTAAGNYRETHWSGAFVDGDGDNLHEFAPGVEVNVFGPGNNTAFQIPAGTILSPSIRWSDWTAIDQDFRLLLLRHNGTAFEIASSSNNPQTGLPGQRPTERTTFITGGAPAVYGVAIQRVNGARDVHLHLLTPNRELDRRSPAMSLGNLADAPMALTAAAVDVDVPFVQEDYSSEGPTNGSGGAPTGGQRKPDLAAFANVSTASYGTRAFNGTSAATPHIAGAAAQVLSAYPTALPGEVQDYLQSRAVNLGAPGADTQFGYGRLWLGGAPGLSDYDFHLFVPFVLATP